MVGESEQQGPEQTFRDTERRLRVKIAKLEAEVERLQTECGIAKETLADWEDGYLTELEDEVAQLKEELAEERTRE